MGKAFLMTKNLWRILNQFLKFKMDIQPRSLTPQERNNAFESSVSVT